MTSSNAPVPTSSREDEAILTLRKWMCCRAGQDQVWRELIVPFAHTLADDEMVERVAVYLWVREMAHYPDDPRSTAAARRRWEGATDQVKESWRRHARRALSAAFSTQEETG